MTTDRVRRPIHLWIVGILSLLWNCVGAFDYTASQLRLEWYLAQFTPEQRAYFEAFPAWSVAAWAFGVWGSVVGSLLLLFGSRFAVWSFAISIAGLAGTTLYQFFFSEGLKMMGTVDVVFSAVIWLVAIALLWYSMRQRDRGVLR